MMNTLRRLAAGLVATLGISMSASAASTGIDWTDNWFVPSESGWGVNIIHQNGVLFATLFVYNQDGTPRFFSASETRGSGNSFSGALFTLTGTWFGMPWAGATPTQTGTLSLNFSGVNSGTLSYTAGGVSVTKQIQRFTFAAENLSGVYLGGMTASSSCSGASQFTLIFDQLRVTHSGSSVSMTVDFFNSQGVSSRCTFTGSYTQAGKLGNITGSYTCTFGATQGNTGTFTVSEISSQVTGFTGRFSGQDNFCSSHNGFFGGVKDVIS